MRYYWCSNCKTPSAWNLDAFGCDPESVIFPCKCGDFEYANEWDSMRKFTRLPEIPERGVVYEIGYQEYRLGDNGYERVS